MISALLGIQIISISFAIFMVYVTFLHYKRGTVNGREFSFWLFCWISFTFFTLFPRVLDPLLAQIFVTRAMDLLMIVAFMILTYLGFQNHIGVKNLQRQISKIVSDQAKKTAKKH
jgi:hypothetical protein